MKDKINEKSSAIYHIDPNEIRKYGLEKLKRTRDNCYKSHKEYKSQQEREKHWDELIKNIKENGVSKGHPIQVMINRKNGNKDQIYQGHHRLAMAIELGLSMVPVQFVTKIKS